MKKKLILLFAALFMSVSATLAAGYNFKQGNIEIISPWVQATNGPDAGLYMEISNTSNQDDKLTYAQSNVSQLNELHVRFTKDGDNADTRIGFIEIPASGNIVLAPDGHHIMLSNISHPLRPSENIQVTLTFKNEGTFSFPVPVRAE